MNALTGETCDTRVISARRATSDLESVAAALEAICNHVDRRGEAQKTLAALPRNAVGQRIKRDLTACLDGTAAVERRHSSYILYEQKEAFCVTSVAAALDDLMLSASKYFGVASPILIVDLRLRFSGISHSHHDLDGLGHIVVSGQCTQPEIPAILGHEIAHCHFICGNRFLDEGLAVHFETGHVSSHNFPASVHEMRALLAQDTELLSLHSLLRWQRQDVIPTALLSNQGQYFTVYAQGWKLIDSWVFRLGREQTLLACRAIGSACDDELEEAFIRSTGQTIAQTSAELFGAESGAHSKSISLPHESEKHRSKTYGDAESRNSASFRETGGNEQYNSDPDERLQPLFLARNALTELLLDLNTGNHDTQSQTVLADVDMLIAKEFQRATPNATAYLVRALRRTISAMSFRNQLSRYQDTQSAISDYDSALRLAPHDTEVLLAVGMFFMNLPPEVGGRPTFARQCLELAASIQLTPEGQPKAK